MTSAVRPEVTPDYLNGCGTQMLVGQLGVEMLTVEQGKLTSRMPVTLRHMGINGYLHAASVVALADSTCGNAAIAHLPEGAKGFTTIDQKCNFIDTMRDGTAGCTATAVHLGHSTQVWDATVFDQESGKTIAVFRATQMILW